MAVLQSNRTTVADLLRTVYEKNMRRQFNLKSILLQTIGRNSKHFVQGKEISLFLYAATGAGYVWSDGGEFNEASIESVKRATFNYKYMVDKIVLSEDLIDDTAASNAADAQALQFHTNALVKRNRHDLNFDLIQSDGSGALATPTAASSATSFTVDDVRGLRQHMRVDVLLTASGNPSTGGVSNVEITFNRKTKVVSIQGGAQLVDGTGTELNTNFANYTVFRAKSYNQAIFGLKAIIANANPTVTLTPRYGGIDRSDDNNDFYRATVHDNLGAVPDFKTMQSVIHEVHDNSEGEINMILAGNDIWSHIVDRLESDKRFGGSQMKLNGWAQAVDFAGIPIVNDKHVKNTEMFFLDTTSFQIYQRDEGRWMDKDGAILSRLENRASYQANWTRRMQLICFAPIANAYMHSIVV